MERHASACFAHPGTARAREEVHSQSLALALQATTAPPLASILPVAVHPRRARRAARGICAREARHRRSRASAAPATQVSRWRPARFVPASAARARLVTPDSRARAAVRKGSLAHAAWVIPRLCWVPRHAVGQARHRCRAALACCVPRDIRAAVAARGPARAHVLQEQLPPLRVHTRAHCARHAARGAAAREGRGSHRTAPAQRGTILPR